MVRYTFKRILMYVPSQISMQALKRRPDEVIGSYMRRVEQMRPGSGAPPQNQQVKSLSTN